MLVSIVTPSFNQGKYLERTIQSVLSQTGVDLEYIVVDGGSSDDSIDIIKRYSKRIAWWVSEKDNGQTDAINKGFGHAHGDILAWLNSDDTYQPCALAEAAAYLKDHPGSGAVYGEANFIDDDDRVIGKFAAAQTDLSRLRRGYVHIPQQSFFFRAELWKKVGPLDPAFYFAMDYDLWVRLAGTTTLDYLPGHVWANFRLHQDAKTISADALCWPEMLKIHYRDGGKKITPIILKYYLRRIVAPFINWRRRQMFKK